MNSPVGRTYTVTVRPQGDPASGWPRFRKWIKNALRGYGLVVVDYREDATNTSVVLHCPGKNDPPDERN